MIFIVAILLYCFLIVIKKILKPRVIKRMYEYDLEANLCFVIICLIYVGYMVFVNDYTLAQLRRLSV